MYSKRNNYNYYNYYNFKIITIFTIVTIITSIQLFTKISIISIITMYYYYNYKFTIHKFFTPGQCSNSLILVHCAIVNVNKIFEVNTILHGSRFL